MIPVFMLVVLVVNVGCARPEAAGAILLLNGALLGWLWVIGVREAARRRDEERQRTRARTAIRRRDRRDRLV